jgi:hypothetical protein
VLKVQCIASCICAIAMFQYLLEAGWGAEGHLIGVTQPRRVAAVTVSCVCISIVIVNIKFVKNPSILCLVSDFLMLVPD